MNPDIETFCLLLKKYQKIVTRDLLDKSVSVPEKYKNLMATEFCRDYEYGQASNKVYICILITDKAVTVRRWR